MPTTTSREVPGDPRPGRDDVPRVVGGRGWRVGEKREGTAWRPAADISEPGDAYRVTVEIPGIEAGEVEITMADGLLTCGGGQDPSLSAGRSAPDPGPQGSAGAGTLIRVRVSQGNAVLAPPRDGAER